MFVIMRIIYQRVHTSLLMSAPEKLTTKWLPMAALFDVHSLYAQMAFRHTAT